MISRLVTADIVRVVQVPVRVMIRCVPWCHFGYSAIWRVVMVVVRRCGVAVVRHSLMVLLLMEMGLVEIGIAESIAVADDLVRRRVTTGRLGV